MKYEERVDATYTQDPERCLESPMEKSLYESLKTHGASPRMQHWVDKYFLDFAFSDLKLAVEYDGAHHMEIENMEKDIERLDRLNEIGWRVYRVWHTGEEFEVTCRDGFRYRSKRMDDVGEIIAHIVRREKRKLKDESKAGLKKVKSDRHSLQA